LLDYPTALRNCLAWFETQGMSMLKKNVCGLIAEIQTARPAWSWMEFLSPGPVEQMR
jgi:hypothetical protein